MSQLYYETSSQHTMPTYTFFINKLKQVQKLSNIAGRRKKSTPLKEITCNIKHYQYSNIEPKLCSFVNQSIIKPFIDCKKCYPKIFYQIGNIVWPSNIKHKIEKHQTYPSDYFIKIILNFVIINDIIVNPPIEVDPTLVKRVNYIPLHYNKLLIIDALMHQGSFPRYENNDKFIYSEHSGVITLKNKMVDNIIVSAETARMDIGDDSIYLPYNSPLMAKHQYLFHTHPNTMTYAGRINEGIIYEFPSANDILNFVKYHDEGRVQASLIIAPEGMYIIRPIKFGTKYKIDNNFYYFLRKFILKLEKLAMKKVNKIALEKKISNPEIFHQQIGNDFRFINIYNRYIEPHNLFIEYYPREKKNGEWCLRPITLHNLAKKD